MPSLVVAAMRGVVGKPIVHNSNIRSKTKVATLSSIALIAVSMTLSTTSMMSTSSQAMSTAVAVPKRMHLSSGMKNSKDWLQTANLIPIDFAPSIGDLVTEKKGEAIDGSEAVKANSGKSGSIAFVVRRPGWVLCREHGQQLTELAASAENELDGFELFGVVKETGVDDEGLRVFQNDHFSYPLYRDENLDFYRAFGDGKITDHLSWWSLINPYNIYKGMKGMSKRMKSKNLTGNYVGEGLKTGGIIIFGSDGEPKYAYPEVTGSEMEVDDFLAAVKDVRGSSSDDANGNEL